MTTIIKSGQCSMLNRQSKGKIHYDITLNQSGERFIRLTKSTGGGFLSQDDIAESDITACLLAIKGNSHFSSTVFNPLFIGKSANNAAFLAAVLRAEHVISKSKTHLYKHTVLNLDALALLKPVK